MKYLLIPFGLFAVIMLLMPFAIVSTEQQATDNAQVMLNQFIEGWNQVPQQLGKVVDAQIVQIQPWVAFGRIGAVIKTDVALENWKGFMLFEISKNEENWGIDSAVKAE